MQKLPKDLVRKIVLQKKTLKNDGMSRLALVITCKRFYRMFSEEERLYLRGLRDLGVTTKAIYISHSGGNTLKSIFTLLCPRCSSTNGLHSGKDAWECLDCDNLFMVKRIQKIKHFKVPIFYQHNCKEEFCKCLNNSSPFIDKGCRVKKMCYYMCEILRIEKYICYPLTRFYKFSDNLDLDAYLKNLWDPYGGYSAKEDVIPAYLDSYLNDPLLGLFPDFIDEDTKENEENTDRIRKELWEMCSEFSDFSFSKDKEEKGEKLKKFCEENDVKISPKKCICKSRKDIEEGRDPAEGYDNVLFTKCCGCRLQSDHEINKLYKLLKRNSLFDGEHGKEIYSKSISYLILYSHIKKKLYVENLFFSKLSPHYKDNPNLEGFIKSLTM